MKDLFQQALELDEAIAALADESPRSAEVVRMRFYAGLGEDEAAQALDVSVRREWAYARAWLFQHLRDAAGGD